MRHFEPNVNNLRTFFKIAIIYFLVISRGRRCFVRIDVGGAQTRYQLSHKAELDVDDVLSGLTRAVHRHGIS